MGIIKKDIYTEAENLRASTFDLLSHPGRLKLIVCLLHQERLALRQITEILGLSQSSASSQVKRMKDAGLLVSVESGTTVFYSLNLVVWDTMKWTLQLYLDDMNELWR
jgi:DNA-binding transcriptional ArsR family regulator